MNPQPAAADMPRLVDAYVARHVRTSTLAPEPPYPGHAFPPQIAAWLKASATVTRVPLSFTASPFLAAAGAVIGNRLALRVGPGWIERPTLWVAIVTSTGIGKTPALSSIRRPLDTLQQEAWEQRQTALAAWRRHPEPRPPRPALERLLVTGGSYHGLATALRHAPGVLILRDELYGLVRAMDRRQGEDRQHYLSLWSSEPILPGPEDDACLIPTPVVGIVGGIQPVLIPKIRRDDQDGFLERFLLLYAEGSEPAWNDTHPEPTGEREITDLLRALRHIPDTPPGGHLVELAEEARLAWADWFADSLDRTHVAGLALGGFYRKLPSHLARLALVLHALWHPESPTAPLDGDTMRRAIDLVEFHRAHVHRVIVLLGVNERQRSPALSLAERVIGVLARATDPHGWVPRTDLLVAIGRPETQAVNDVIEALANTGALQQRTVGSGPAGGRPATHYRLLVTSRA